MHAANCPCIALPYPASNPWWLLRRHRAPSGAGDCLDTETETPHSKNCGVESHIFISVSSRDEG